MNSIIKHLRKVAAERKQRQADPSLIERVLALKTYQQQRFAHTYSDLLTSPRYGAVGKFFLQELYGPSDFSERDAQFERVVPTLVRLFSADMVETIDTLAQLHALSEELDGAMATHLPDTQVNADTYIKAWQKTGRTKDREKQIKFTLSVGHSLDQLTRRPLVRQSLRLMRVPAQMAGLGELQRFLETGFDTFKAMSGAQEFLSTIEERENALIHALFQSDNNKPFVAEYQKGLSLTLP